VLLRAVDRGIPPPLGGIRNQRTLLTWRISPRPCPSALEHPRAANAIYLVGNDPPVSSPELVCALARALHRQPRLLPAPVRLLRVTGALAGRAKAVIRLTFFPDGRQLLHPPRTRMAPRAVVGARNG